MRWEITLTADDVCERCDGRGIDYVTGTLCRCVRPAENRDRMCAVLGEVGGLCKRPQGHSGPHSFELDLEKGASDV